ncbi:MAG: hypothetical protein IKD59_09040 [Lachnospiraceae bacterium]|nr:hypothetical protein [Lachnospiraceae bacterium]MBR3374186.1 hypothetical protein [Bacillota bacterium]
METSQELSLLKANLELRNKTQDDYLDHLIKSAKEEIAIEGITLNDSPGDTNLVVMYAAYLYRRRVKAGNDKGYSTEAFNPQGMPYMLRYALNNRLMSEKMRAES